MSAFMIIEEYADYLYRLAGMSVSSDTDKKRDEFRLAIATLREENARLRAVLTGIASPPLTNVPDESYSSYDEGFDDGLAWAKGKAEALLARKDPEAKGESGEAADWDALKRTAEDHFEIVARHAREGKKLATASGDIDEAQCFDCEIKTLGRGFDCWLAARALLARKPAEARGPEVGE